MGEREDAAWRKAVEYSLGILESHGIIVKSSQDDGRWWYIGHKVACRKEDYESLMKHASLVCQDFLNYQGNEEYCKIDAQYSKEIDKMVPLKTKEPDDLQLYEEAMGHLKSYGQLLGDLKKFKQITLKLNEKLASIFEQMRVLIKKEVDLPYWCLHYPGDEPDEYLCPNTFIRAIFFNGDNKRS